MSASRTILDAAGVEKAIAAMAATLAGHKGDAPLAIIGIRRGGEPLALRLANHLEKITGQKPPVGTVDITLYRDDGFGPHDWPSVGTSRIAFDLPKHTVVLVDDVLFTGRTVRAAVDAILDYGRPKAVRLAVLIDRGLRELPIAADAVGKVIETRPDEHVTVQLGKEPADSDSAMVEPAKVKPPQPARPAKGGRK